jgi:hypothetical protein
MLPELLSRGHSGYAECPDHGPVLRYHEDQGDEWEWREDQGDEWEWREDLECSAPGCGYEAWE